MNIKGALCSKTVVIYRCGSCVFDAAVIDGVFAISILFFMFFVVIITLIFPFVNIIRSEIELCFLFFVTEGMLTFFNNVMFSLL